MKRRNVSFKFSRVLDTGSSDVLRVWTGTRTYPKCECLDSEAGRAAKPQNSTIYLKWESAHAKKNRTINNKLNTIQARAPNQLYHFCSRTWTRPHRSIYNQLIWRNKKSQSTSKLAIGDWFMITPPPHFLTSLTCFNASCSMRKVLLFIFELHCDQVLVHGDVYLLTSWNLRSQYMYLNGEVE